MTTLNYYFMTNTIDVLLVMSFVQGVCAFILALTAIIASVRLIKTRAGIAYTCIISTILTFGFDFINFFSPNPILSLGRILFFIIMFISAIFVWFNLRKSSNNTDRQMAGFLLAFLLIQIIIPAITATIKTSLDLIK